MPSTDGMTFAVLGHDDSVNSATATPTIMLDAQKVLKAYETAGLAYLKAKDAPADPRLKSIRSKPWFSWL